MSEQLPAVIDRTEIIDGDRAHLDVVPALIAAGDRASYRFLEFFAANIRNPHTRQAYSRAVTDFLAWCLILEPIVIGRAPVLLVA